MFGKTLDIREELSNLWSIADEELASIPGLITKALPTNLNSLPAEIIFIFPIGQEQIDLDMRRGWFNTIHITICRWYVDGEGFERTQFFGSLKGRLPLQERNIEIFKSLLDEASKS